MQNLGMPLPSQQLPQATPVLKSSLTQVGPQDTSLQSSPAREEGEVPESELDPDTRRRLLILQHGMDNREHAPGESQLPVRPSVPASVPRVQPRSWFPTEEEMGPGQLNRVLPPKDFPLSADSMHMEKHRPHHPPYLHKMDGAVPSDRLVESQMLSKEASCLVPLPNVPDINSVCFVLTLLFNSCVQAIPSDDRMRLNQSLPRFQSFSGK